jgi:hypothetical protein
MRKKTRRKQQWGLINPLNHAILGAGITQEHLLDKLRMRELASIDAMAKGAGTLTEWQELADLLNVCEVMGIEGIGPEVLPFCKEAQQALLEAAKVYEQTQVMRLSDEGINAFREIYEYHDLQRKSVARSVYEKMIIKTRQRLRSRSKEVVEICCTH